MELLGRCLRRIRTVVLLLRLTGSAPLPGWGAEWSGVPFEPGWPAVGTAWPCVVLCGVCDEDMLPDPVAAETEATKTRRGDEPDED